MNDEEQRQAVRRLVGIATLRRLRTMVSADEARRQAEGRWAARLSWAFAGLAALAVLVLLAAALR